MASRVGLRRPRQLGGVLALVLALLAAPSLSALRVDCDLCPPDCPMHRQQGGAHGAVAHLGCHHTAASAGNHSAAPAAGPSVGCASCGNHGLMPNTILPPMILPAAAVLLQIGPAHPARVHVAGLNGRGIDPPDTPPPIGVA